jgi:hypothetical protein
MSIQEVIHPVLKTDSRIVSTPTYFADVYSTPQSIAQNIYPSNSNNNANSHLFNIQTPSTDVMINRNFIIEAEIKLRLQTGAGSTATDIFNTFYGQSLALSSFPLNRLCNTQTLTMNNLNTTVNSVEILNELVHLFDEDDLVAMSGTSNCPDYMAIYDGPKIVKDNSAQENIYALYHNNLPNGLPNSLGNYFNSKVKSKLQGNATNVEVVSVTAVQGVATQCDVVFRVREPLLGLSPLTAGEDAYSKTRGMMGITNLQLTMNFNNGSRVMRSARYSPDAAEDNYVVSCVLQDISNARLFITYYSLKPSQLPNPRNCLPYYSFNQIYSTETGLKAEGSVSSVQSPNIQLSVIPDLILLSVEPLNYTGIITANQNEARWAGDWAASINSVSIQFNNQNGILSNASKFDLWNMSRCTYPLQEWSDYNGSFEYLDSTLVLNANPAQTPYGNFTYERRRWPSAHCHLALKFGEHISIPQEFLAPGSLGSFNFSVNVNFTNQASNGGNNVGGAPKTWHGLNTNFRLKMIFITKGSIINELGSSTQLIGFFNSQMVLSAVSDNNHGVSSRTLSKYIGKGKMDMEGEGLFDWVIDNTVGRIPVIGGVASSVAKKIVPFGSGTSGGGLSGGGASNILDKYKL